MGRSGTSIMRFSMLLETISLCLEMDITVATMDSNLFMMWHIGESSRPNI